MRSFAMRWRGKDSSGWVESFWPTGRPIIIEPMGAGLRGITLRYAHEVRSETEYFADIPRLTLPDEMLRRPDHVGPICGARGQCRFVLQPILV